MRTERTKVPSKELTFEMKSPSNMLFAHWSLGFCQILSFWRGETKRLSRKSSPWPGQFQAKEIWWLPSWILFLLSLSRLLSLTWTSVGSSVWIIAWNSLYLLGDTSIWFSTLALSPLLIFFSWGWAWSLLLLTLWVLAVSTLSERSSNTFLIINLEIILLDCQAEPPLPLRDSHPPSHDA